MQMGYDFYITPEEYARAAANGIKANTLEVRVRCLGWDKERAMTTPPRRVSDHSAWHALAESNGISKHLFRVRVNRNGWSPERAATEPLTTKDRRRELVLQAKSYQLKYPPEVLARAAANGVRPDTFYARIHRGWDVDRAADTPLISPEQKGRNRVQWLRERGLDPSASVFQKR
ncbi:hypothetical protein [Paenibacillus tritici]|nr:hypothetical protein [Paenibacillus tritici]